MKKREVVPTFVLHIYNTVS